MKIKQLKYLKQIAQFTLKSSLKIKVYMSRKMWENYFSEIGKNILN